MLADPVFVARRMAEVFNKLGIAYFVGGSLASSPHGVPRSTQDVDMVADLQPRHAAMLADALAEEFYADAQMIRDAIAGQSSFNVIYMPTMFKVDVFAVRKDPAAQEEMARRELYQMDDGLGQILYAASPEDIILNQLNKLYWFQLGGGVSDRQWSDALGVIRVKRDSLDYEYLRRGASARGVSELLDRILAESKATTAG